MKPDIQYGLPHILLLFSTLVLHVSCQTTKLQCRPMQLAQSTLPKTFPFVSTSNNGMDRNSIRLRPHLSMAVLPPPTSPRPHLSLNQPSHDPRKHQNDRHQPHPHPVLHQLQPRRRHPLPTHTNLDTSLTRPHFPIRLHQILRNRRPPPHPTHNPTTTNHPPPLGLAMPPLPHPLPPRPYPPLPLRRPLLLLGRNGPPQPQEEKERSRVQFRIRL